MWRNSTTQIVIKFKNSNCDKTQNSNCDKSKKTQIVTKLKNSNNEKNTQKLKLWLNWNSKTWIVTKLLKKLWQNYKKKLWHNSENKLWQSWATFRDSCVVFNPSLMHCTKHSLRIEQREKELKPCFCSLQFEVALFQGWAKLFSVKNLQYHYNSKNFFKEIQT